MKLIRRQDLRKSIHRTLIPGLRQVFHAVLGRAGLSLFPNFAMGFT